MAPYDSESSDGEEQDYTETDILLGYTDKDPKGEAVSRLGGHAEWLIPDNSPSAALARCKVCKDLMVLLLQLNGELPDRFPGHERRIYVFSCRKKTCRRKEGSIRAVRGTRATAQATSSIRKPEKKMDEPKKGSSKPASGLGESLFGVKAMDGSSSLANPFSTSTSANPFSSKPSTGAKNPFAASPTTVETQSPPPDLAKDLPKTFAETLTLNNPQQPHGAPPPPEAWPEESSQPSPYPILWISEAEYETLDPTPLVQVPTASGTMDLDNPFSSGGGGAGKEDREVFESAMDTTFQKFADRIGQNPEQVIRYEFGGQPLLYSKEDGIGSLFGGGAGGLGVNVGKEMPRCANCGGSRVFEVQLMPHAIAELEAEEEGMDGMDWGTIIVGVCERDCQEWAVGEGDASYLEEWAGVQWEEVAAKR